MSYGLNAIESGYADSQIKAANAIDHNPTVGENLERRIAMLEAELDRMKKSRETLGPLLNMRIRDIRDAMNY